MQVASGSTLFGPTWTPDGSRILFSDGLPAELYGVGAGGGAVARLTETVASEQSPSTTGGTVAPFAQSAPAIDGGDAPSVGDRCTHSSRRGSERSR